MQFLIEKLYPAEHAPSGDAPSGHVELQFKTARCEMKFSIDKRTIEAIVLGSSLQVWTATRCYMFTASAMILSEIYRRLT